MLILTFRILCVDKIGSRAAAACISEISEIITITTKISAPGRLQNVDFQPPALLVYETHHEDRLGKNMGGGAPNEIFLESSIAGRLESVLFRRAACVAARG